mgnify:CR=1 FL=1
MFLSGLHTLADARLSSNVALLNANQVFTGANRFAGVVELTNTAVAILPFADQAGVPGISRALADRVYAEVSRHVRPEQFVFTRLVDPGQVYARITVAELDGLTRADAIRIGRRLGRVGVEAAQVDEEHPDERPLGRHQVSGVDGQRLDRRGD